MNIDILANKENPKSFLTTREAASLLNVSLQTVQNWTENGILECWKTTGGHRRIPRQSVKKLLTNPAPSTASPSLEPTALLNRDGKLRILLIEQDPNASRNYRLKMAAWSINPEVICTSNGIKALLHIGQELPDLLIADLQMSGANGLMMLQIIRSMPEFDQVEIIAITEMTAQDLAAQGELPEGIPVLQKPIEFDELEKLVKLIINQRKRYAMLKR